MGNTTTANTTDFELCPVCGTLLMVSSGMSAGASPKSNPATAKHDIVRVHEWECSGCDSYGGVTFRVTHRDTNPELWG
jgi:hypothetical protein